MTDRDVNAWFIVGNTLNLAGNVASKFPKDFAEVVAKWHPDKIGDIIEALEERRKINGDNV